MIYNFSAGPAVLFSPVLERIQREIVDYKQSGYSLLEASHRGALYKDVHEKAIALLRHHLALSDEFEVLLLGGGASLQFSMIPYNFLNHKHTAQYIITGAWGKKAYADAIKLSKYGLASCAYKTPHAYTTIPQESSIVFDAKPSYVHITSNETIDGVQWKHDPVFDAPLIADMSSDIVSRVIDANKYAGFYAGAQKNIGPAGVTIVVLRKSLLEHARHTLPSYLSYETHVKQNSLYNTPPVFSIWAMSLVLEHIKSLGGVPYMQTLNEKKASLLYSTIDESGGFFTCPVDTAYRSTMNVVFRLPTEELEQQFIAYAQSNNLLGLSGHRSVGGCRASIYNAMPIEGVDALRASMKDFCKRYG